MGSPLFVPAFGVPPGESPPVTLLGRYALRQPLGRGGMSVVWRAEDVLLSRPVAVKAVELPSSVPEEERASLQARVMREARAAARLNHPNATTVFDVFSENGRAYLVMELVDGPTLGELVERDGPLPPERVAELGLVMLDVLRAAHTAGIVHRDVKPSNVMVTPSGTVKLADFGIAAVADDPKITMTGFVLGSPSYMAPEQARGLDVGPASDLWGLGATLAFAVQGAPPFDRPSGMATLAAVLNDEPHVGPEAGPLRRVLLSLLDKEAGRRPSHGELRALLSGIVGTPPAPVRSPGSDATETAIRAAPAGPA
nr:serine/threonine protein kinase [Euzebyaceae bacterium]